MKNTAILFLLFLLFSCNKIEGEGGTSSITGIVTANEFKNDGTLKATYFAVDEDVYIIYGANNTTYNDKVSTSFDGSYRIDNLVKGTYQLFSYSKCKNCPSNTKEVLIEVEISNNGEIVTAPELIIEK